MKRLLSLVLVVVCLGETGLPIEAATESLIAKNRVTFSALPQRSVAERNNSFGDSLLQFSEVIRGRNVSAIGRWFHRQVRFSDWPQLDVQNASGDLVVHSRGFGSNERTLNASRATVLKSWESFLSQFRRIEAVRFAVIEPVFVGENPVCVEAAELRFVLVGTDQKGCRFWLSGAGRVDADLTPDAGWRFSGFQVDRVDEYRCPPDLLAEKSENADAGRVHALSLSS